MPWHRLSELHAPTYRLLRVIISGKSTFVDPVFMKTLVTSFSGIYNLPSGIYILAGFSEKTSQDRQMV